MPVVIQDSSAQTENEISAVTPDPAFNLTLSKSKKIIILLTSFRSGSTFLGQIFDSNPKIQYLFEPFFNNIIWRLYKQGKLIGAKPRHSDPELKMLYLQQIMHNCSVHPTNFGEKHERCGAAEENLKRFGTEECSKKIYEKPEELYQEICRHRSTTVMKLIRMKDITDLLKIQQIRTADLKVVHLVRHPVPLMMSRRWGGKFFMWDVHKSVESSFHNLSGWRTRLAYEMFNYCSENYQVTLAAEEDAWLKNHYLRVSHHDMSLHPVQTAQKIYDFVGETLTKDVKSYLREISGVNSDNSDKGNPEDALNVYKNSTELIYKWKDFGMYGKYMNLFPIEMQCRQIYDILREKSEVDVISRAAAYRVQADLLDRSLFDYFK